MNGCADWTAERKPCCTRGRRIDLAFADKKPCWMVESNDDDAAARLESQG